MTSLRIIILLFFLLSLNSCLKDEPIKLKYEGFEPKVFDDGWQISTPEDEGINRLKLSSVYEMIYEEKRYPLAMSLLVFRNGKLVAEAYPKDKNDISQFNNIQSCTKSITSLLMGIAMEQNLFTTTDEKLYDIYPELFDNDTEKRQMSISDALTMRTGLDFRNSMHSRKLYSTTQNSTKFVLSLNRNQLPGTAVQYHDGAPHLISKALEVRSGNSLSDFAKVHLFQKLGIINWKWENANDGTTFGAFSLFLTARDFGKIGQLLLQNGTWNSEQIISSNYLQEATSNQVTNNLNSSPYGYYFWIYPSWNAYAARGHGGQFLFIAPDKNLVVVHTSWPYSGSELWGDSVDLMRLIYESCE